MCHVVDAMNVNDKERERKVSYLASSEISRQKNCLLFRITEMALHAISGLESLLNFKSSSRCLALLLFLPQ